jgi:hypothetical protein
MTRVTKMLDTLNPTSAAVATRLFRDNSHIAPAVRLRRGKTMKYQDWLQSTPGLINTVFQHGPGITANVRGNTGGIAILAARNTSRPGAAATNRGNTARRRSLWFNAGGAWVHVNLRGDVVDVLQMLHAYGQRGVDTADRRAGGWAGAQTAITSRIAEARSIGIVISITVLGSNRSVYRLHSPVVFVPPDDDQPVVHLLDLLLPYLRRSRMELTARRRAKARRTDRAAERLEQKTQRELAAYAVRVGLYSSISEVPPWPVPARVVPAPAISALNLGSAP